MGLQILVKFGPCMVGILLSSVGSLAIRGRQGDRRFMPLKKKRQEAGSKLA